MVERVRTEGRAISGRVLGPEIQKTFELRRRPEG